MKIKKVKVGGKDSGEVVELTAEEKAPLTLQEAVIDHADFKDKVHVWLRDTKVDSVRTSLKGEPLNKKWQNNIYYATGSCVIHRRNLDKDYLLTPKSCRFELSFEDCLDNLGQPDTKHTKLELIYT